VGARTRLAVALNGRGRPAPSRPAAALRPAAPTAPSTPPRPSKPPGATASTASPRVTSPLRVTSTSRVPRISRPLTAPTTDPIPGRARRPDERRHADAGGAAGRDRRGGRIAGALGDRRVRPAVGRPPPVTGRRGAGRAPADRPRPYGRPPTPG